MREQLNFWTTPDVAVPCYFLIPKRAKFSVPAVAALHDHGGFYYWGNEKLAITSTQCWPYRKEYYDGVSFPASLAQRGYAASVIEMFYHGERRLILDEDSVRGTNDRSKLEPEETIRQINHRAGSSEEIVFRNILRSGFIWGGVLVWEDIRAVDYLQTRPEVDPNRIACAGLSVGGCRTVFLAGLDPRIKTACLVGWMTSFRYLIPPRFTRFPRGWSLACSNIRTIRTPARWRCRTRSSWSTGSRTACFLLMGLRLPLTTCVSPVKRSASRSGSTHCFSTALTSFPSRHSGK